ncbi:MAG: hypothetical protein EOP84_34655 [Verrucomicrobiaceae bacterium]|nr:MAG: hypothetical protein EOP84_34655 [Verrucomicrobiaceae bacterium]
MRTTYVRFVVGTNREEPREQTGVVASLRLLRDRGQLPDYEVEHVEELFLWLNTHLPCPPFEGKNWSPDAISWFKASAQSMISKFRELISILEQHDQPVQMLTTERPGMILYEDDFQVVAQSRHY